MHLLRPLALLTVTVAAGAVVRAVRLPSPPSSPPVPDARRGLALLQHFNDSLPRNGGNALRCTSCHLDDGTRGTAMSWIGATSRFPKYRSRRGSVETIAQRVNECIARSLAGRMLPEDSRAMGDMVAYFESLRTMAVPARPDTVRLVGDTVRGAAGFVASCARCHGATGRGGVAPAVAGARSYSIGAGLARQNVLATFLRWNMPQDRPGTLEPQLAADIAAWMLRQPRQDHPGKAGDWPKGDPPSDVAYATAAARARGAALPAQRPLLRRRVAPLPAR
ncbi:MAG: c-type cytochrome [Gemmatimonadaceae bacterium]|nr:c-type cytochrome [Gemmatimonadaceae bacterium]